MSVRAVEIEILGRSLKINCPDEQKAALDQAANDLNQRLQNLKNKTKVSSTEQLIFTVALNVCHELAQEQAKTRDNITKMEQRIAILQKTIEDALRDNAQTVEHLAHKIEK